jgi:hypothetical protein
MDFERVQAEWVLNRFPREQLPEVAAQAMMAGFEGPFILDLVSYAAPTLDRLKPQVVEGAFREMGLPPVTRPQAVVRLAQREAARILRGDIFYLEGADRILRLVQLLGWESLPRPLHPFRILCYQGEMWHERPTELAMRVREVFWALLEADG